MPKEGGIYRAIVEDTADPENRGRCRVRISPFHNPSQPIESLPWAEPLQPIGGNNSFNMLYVPPKGSTIYVSFINGDTSNPVIVGYWRRASFPIPKSVIHVNNIRDHSFLFMKFGAKQSSPFFSFDAKTEVVKFGTLNNHVEYGGSFVGGYEKGAINNYMTRSAAALEFARGLKGLIGNRPPLASLSHAITMYNDGISLLSVRDSERLSYGKVIEKIGIINEPVPPPDAWSKISGLSGAIKGLVASIPGAQELQKIFNGIDSIIGENADRGGWDPNKSLAANIAISGARKAAGNIKQWMKEKRSLRAEFKKLPGAAKDAFSKIAKSRFKKGGIKGLIKSIKDDFQKAVDAQKAKYSVNNPLEEKTVFGGQNIKIMGAQRISVQKSMLGVYNGNVHIKNNKETSIEFVKKLTIKFIQGEASISTPKNILFFMTGKSKCQILRKISPGPSPFVDKLAKKMAWQDLNEKVDALITWASSFALAFLTHMHQCTAPGAPSTPPTVGVPPPSTIKPASAEPSIIRLLAKTKAMSAQNIPYFTDALEAS